MQALKARLKSLLIWSQKYTRTDMVYLARGGFWTAFNFFFAGSISVLLAIAFANLLPKDVYGTYKYILSIAGTFGFLSLTGMNTAVARAVARGHEGALTHSVRIQLRWNLLYTLALTAAGAWYLLRHQAATLGVSLLALGLLMPPAWAFATYAAFVAGKKDFKRGAQYSILGSTIYLAVMLLGILLGRSAFWLVVAYGASNCGMYALLYVLTLAKYKPSHAIDAQERKEMLDFGKHLSLVNVLSVVAQQIDNIAVFRLVGPAELAVYAFANLIPDRLKNLAKSCMGVVMPKLAAKDLHEVVRSLRLRAFQALVIGAAAAAAYMLVVPAVFRYVFPQYQASVFYSQLIAMNLLFTVPGTYVAYALQSQKLIRQLYLTSLVVNVVRILLIVAAGFLWSTIGVIAAKLAGNAFSLIFGLILLRRSTRKRVASAAPLA